MVPMLGMMLMMISMMPVTRGGHFQTENRKTKPNRTNLTDFFAYSVYGFSVRWKISSLFGVRFMFGFRWSKTEITEETDMYDVCCLI